jgi:hypothetical protein
LTGVLSGFKPLKISSQINAASGCQKTQNPKVAERSSALFFDKFGGFFCASKTLKIPLKLTVRLFGVRSNSINTETGTLRYLKRLFAAF